MEKSVIAFWVSVIVCVIIWDYSTNNNYDSYSFIFALITTVIAVVVVTAITYEDIIVKDLKAERNNLRQERDYLYNKNKDLKLNYDILKAAYDAVAVAAVKEDNVVSCDFYKNNNLGINENSIISLDSDNYDAAYFRTFIFEGVPALFCLNNGQIYDINILLNANYNEIKVMSVFNITISCENNYVKTHNENFKKEISRFVTKVDKKETIRDTEDEIIESIRE